MADTKVPQTGIKNADELITLATAYGLTVTVETTDRETLTAHMVRFAVPVPVAYAGTELGRAIASDTLTVLWTKSNRKGARGRMEDATAWGAVSHRKVRTLRALTAHVETMGRASTQYARETAPLPDDVVDAPHALHIDGEVRKEGIPADRVRTFVKNRRFNGLHTHQDADGAIVCDTRRYVPMRPAPAGALPPAVQERQHVRIVDGGPAQLIPTRTALDEINHAMMDGKRDVRRMSASRSSARIVYRDARGTVDLRPATREDAAAVAPFTGKRPALTDLTGPISDATLTAYCEMYAAVADGIAVPVRADMLRPGMEVIAAVLLKDRITATVEHYNGPATPWVAVTYENSNHRNEGGVFQPDFHLMVTVESLTRMFGPAGDTAAKERAAAAVKDRTRAVRFAGKWWAERSTEEPTDDAMRATFAGCGKPPRPELYPLIREAIAAEKPPVAAAPLFAALAAYEATALLGTGPSPRELHTLEHHLEALRVGTPPALLPELFGAREDLEEAWGALRTADNLAKRTHAFRKADAAVKRARAVVLAVAPHAERMRGTDMPATAEEIRAAAYAYNAVQAGPEERAAIDAGTPRVRVHCSSDSGAGWNVTATITAGVDSAAGFIPGHPPIVAKFRRLDGREDAAVNARRVIGARFRVGVPVEYVADRRV